MLFWFVWINTLIYWLISQMLLQCRNFYIQMSQSNAAVRERTVMFTNCVEITANSITAYAHPPLDVCAGGDFVQNEPVLSINWTQSYGDFARKPWWFKKGNVEWNDYWLHHWRSVWPVLRTQCDLLGQQRRSSHGFIRQLTIIDLQHLSADLNATHNCGWN